MTPPTGTRKKTPGHRETPVHTAGQQTTSPAHHPRPVAARGRLRRRTPADDWNQAHPAAGQSGMSHTGTGHQASEHSLHPDNRPHRRRPYTHEPGEGPADSHPSPCPRASSPPSLGVSGQGSHQGNEPVRGTLKADQITYRFHALQLRDSTNLRASARSIAKFVAGDRGADGFERRLGALGASRRPAGADRRAWLRTALEQLGARRLRHPGTHRYALSVGRNRAERSRTVFGMPALPYPKWSDGCHPT